MKKDAGQGGGLSRKDILKQLSSMLGADPSYVAISFSKPELAGILGQLERYERPEEIVPKGEKPQWDGKASPKEYET